LRPPLSLLVGSALALACSGDPPAPATSTHVRALNGALSNWTQTGALNEGKVGHGVATANGYLYAIGSANGSGDVEYAHPDPSTGVIANWSRGSPLPAGKQALGAAATNGFLYALSGSNTSGAPATPDVVVAPIDPATGAVGTWTYTTALPDARSGAAAATSGGYLYVIGGGARTTCCFNTVFYAQINPSNGTPGSWSMATMPVLVLGAAAVAHNGFLYVAGGLGGPALPPHNLNTVMYAQLQANGAPGAWTTVSAPWTARRDLAVAALGDYLYVVGGTADNNHPATSDLPDVWVAPLNSNGSIGTWTTTSALPSPRRRVGLAGLGTFLYATGGTAGNASNKTSQVLYASASPCIGAPNGTPCSDGDPCNGMETCQGGVCMRGTPLTCDDQNPCTDDSCAAPGGCQYTPRPDGTPCPSGSCSGGLCRTGGGGAGGFGGGVGGGGGHAGSGGTAGTAGNRNQLGVEGCACRAAAAQAGETGGGGWALFALAVGLMGRRRRSS